MDASTAFAAALHDGNRLARFRFETEFRGMATLYRRLVLRFLQFPITIGALLFLPAWTFDYWQGWLFSAVFLVCNLALSVDLAIRDPALLERRMRAGPRAEKEPAQKIAVIAAFVSFGAALLLPALDRRFLWSNVPVWLVTLGDVLVVLAYVGFFLVMKANSYAAATIQIAQGQTVISTGPYALVRHPMYTAALVLVIGIPLALGSWWGLLAVALALPALLWRIVHEEKFLASNLSGYSDYQNKVRYRLIPFVR